MLTSPAAETRHASCLGALDTKKNELFFFISVGFFRSLQKEPYNYRSYVRAGSNLSCTKYKKLKKKKKVHKMLCVTWEISLNTHTQISIIYGKPFW